MPVESPDVMLSLFGDLSLTPSSNPFHQEHTSPLSCGPDENSLFALMLQLFLGAHSVFASSVQKRGESLTFNSGLVIFTVVFKLLFSLYECSSNLPVNMSISSNLSNGKQSLQLRLVKCILVYI